MMSDEEKCVRHMKTKVEILKRKRNVYYSANNIHKARITQNRINSYLKAIKSMQQKIENQND